MSGRGVISVFDDDVSVREATARLIRSMGFPVEAFDSAEAFLRSGRLLQLLSHLAATGYRIPIIFTTADGDERERSRLERLISSTSHVMTKLCLMQFAQP